MQKLNAIMPADWSHNNPVDVLGDAPAGLFHDAAEIVLQDENVDGLLALYVPVATTTPEDVANALLPLDWLLLDSMPLRLLVAGAVLGWPLAASSVIFVRFFSATQRAASALSINLLGAVAGGLLEVVTYVFGLSSADLVAMVLYVLALALIREPAVRAQRDA